MEIDEAIELLRKNYAKACSLGFVRHKVAWALYQTWKAAAAEANREVSRA